MFRAQQMIHEASSQMSSPVSQRGLEVVDLGGGAAPPGPTLVAAVPPGFIPGLPVSWSALFCSSGPAPGVHPSSCLLWHP